MKVNELIDSLNRARDFVQASQLADGTWEGSVDSDPRVTGFYLITIASLDREPSTETKEMEAYLAESQLDCGAWQAWPGGPPDIDVTTTCALALRKATTEPGRQAKSRAQAWLSLGPHPHPDSFWRGLLALIGELSWADLPYLSPRIVTNPDWLHPNIYDFSFLRIAIVCASLLQTCSCPASDQASLVEPDCCIEGGEAFVLWKRRWVAECREPIQGILPSFCAGLRWIDRIFPVERHIGAALNWLLRHQEADGSFFSSVHMTSIAITTLYRLDAPRYEQEVQAGLNAMRRWQRSDGKTRHQQFTDSANWDTLLFLDLMAALGLPANDPQVMAARDHVIGSQIVYHGDWSHRTRDAQGSAWGFQRVGKCYPDNDDTVMAVSALLQLEPESASNTVKNGIRWLLSMQSSSGGWASWDRDDRAWIQIPEGGAWFARDHDSVEITAKIIVLFSKILSGKYSGLDDLMPQLRNALVDGERWLRQKACGGAWYGSWFTHFLYGTCHVLEAWRALGNIPGGDGRASFAWLKSIVNPDGGFGEAPISDEIRGFVSAPSTPFHTSCALLAFTYLGEEQHPVANGAAKWLLDHQDDEGCWTNKDFFAAGVPGLWYARFSLTPTYYAAKSLLLFYRARFAGAATL